jgi:hypothetical protein
MQLEVQVTPAIHALPPRPVLTPKRTALSLGMGLMTRDQAAPFQRRMSAWLIFDEIEQWRTQVAPAAQALPSGAALTAFRNAPRPRRELATCDQVLPSQCKIKGCAFWAVSQAVMQVPPTAQAVPPGPVVTPSRAAWLLGLGLGVGDQVVPFQRKISVRPVAGEVKQPGRQAAPTAQALPPGPALTPVRNASPARLGVGACDQSVPSQRKISGLTASGGLKQRGAQV